MIKPSYDEVLNLKDNYSVIPIYKEIYADAFTPINLLRKIAGKSDKFFLLESIEGGEKWARYSFIGFNPKARLSYKNGTLTVTGEGARVVKTAKPYDALREYLADYKTPHFKDIPPFTGGLVGYFGYAMISVAEPVLKLKRGDTNDFDMMLFDKIIAYDHLKEKLIIIVNMKTNDTKAQYELAKKDIAEIISTITSPEPLPKLQNGVLNTFPIAGSRPRGKTDTEDNALADELIHDEKELAEHNMLVDLGRNDIGKISEFNSVKVTKYQEVLRYSKIMHICSEVEGKLKDGLDAFDAIESLLPAGTLSGAPKIRACEIIEELERTPRGVYGGALGYVDFNGNLDTCIAIRMAVKKNDKVYVQAGAGIVADSVPESEYEETYNKALAVMNAVKNAGEVNAL